jgi:hypothetical protein
MTDGVIEFKLREKPETPEDDDRMLTRVPGRKHCLHRQYLIDETQLKVFCKECEAEIPVFDAMLDLCRRVERWMWERQQHERAARESAKTAEECKRIERNAKARLRRAMGAVPDCSCDAGLRQRIARAIGWQHGWSWCPVCGGKR